MLILLTFVMESSFNQNLAIAQSYQKNSFKISAKSGRYLKVGTDKTSGDGEDVYLDKKSIKKTKSNSCKYTVIGDPSRRNGFEFDFIVNCKNTNSIIHTSQRFYTNGRLFKTEKLGANQNTEALRDSSTFPEYESNIAVCNIVSK